MGITNNLQFIENSKLRETKSFVGTFKIYTFLICSLLATIGTVHSQTKVATISGKTAGKNYNLILVEDGGKVRKIIKPNENAEFRDTLHIKSETYEMYEVKFSKDFKVALRENSDIVLDLTQPTENVKEIISGNDAFISHFYVDKENFFNTHYDGNIYKEKPVVFKNKLKELFANWDKQWKSYPFEPIRKNEEKWSKYAFVQMLVYYPRVNQMHRKSFKETKVPEDFFEEEKSIDYDNADEFEKVNTYRKLVMSKLSSLLTDPNDTKQVQQLIDKTEKVRSQNIKAAYQETISGLIDHGNPNNELIYNYIMKNSASEKLRKECEYIFLNTEKSVKKGSKSPSFSFENEKGEKVSLEDFRGKLVYIDVWASWCGPCISEIPYLKKLEADFKGKEVVFVSISKDIKKEHWQQALEKHQLKGIQLWGGNKSDFYDAYFINSIPRFILIDKKGKVISPSAPEPSAPKIKELIEESL
ncbi:TlpA family protein disulfide reductase [Capnocytophaga canis]|uniref:TlpA family protein disulfide reductase n=1 Tax=Capnocytophaga canis TaxID=1848903 RepID=UPI001561D873|nr:TlpA disulfide reductase family protein [Capnocytophaga canis]